MLQRLQQSIWLRIFLFAILLGIWPGIAVGQPHGIFFGAVFGWFMLLLELFARFTHTEVNNPVLWLQWLAALGYLLAVFGYGACASWAIRLTRSLRRGLMITALAAVVSTLASIPPAIVTLSIIQKTNVFIAAFYYPLALSIHVFILVNLLISAVLGWLLALVWAKFRGSDSLLATT